MTSSFSLFLQQKVPLFTKSSMMCDLKCDRFCLVFLSNKDNLFLPHDEKKEEEEVLKEKREREGEIHTHTQKGNIRQRLASL